MRNSPSGCICAEDLTWEAHLLQFFGWRKVECKNNIFFWSEEADLKRGRGSERGTQGTFVSAGRLQETYSFLLSSQSSPQARHTSANINESTAFPIHLHAPASCTFYRVSHKESRRSAALIAWHRRTWWTKSPGVISALLVHARVDAQ